MNKYKVIISYEIVIFAENENRAAIIADGAVNLIVEHPQTGDVIQATTEIEELEQQKKLDDILAQ